MSGRSATRQKMLRQLQSVSFLPSVVAGSGVAAGAATRQENISVSACRASGAEIEGQFFLGSSTRRGSSECRLKITLKDCGRS